MVKHETYVNLETAKLLKQAGFDWEVNHRWQNWSNYADTTPFFLNALDYYEDSNDDVSDDAFSAPTIEVAQKWLREVKGICVESVLCVNRGTSVHSYGFSIAEVSADLSIVKILHPLTYFDEEETKGFKKYELSLEAGIMKALELILEKGE